MANARAEVTLRSKTMVLDFEGDYEVEHGKPAGLRLVAELPDAGGQEDGGTVLLEQAGDALTATVVQPGGKLELSTAVRWTAAGRDVEPVGEIAFMLPESPDATVLSIRGLVLRAT